MKKLYPILLIAFSVVLLGLFPVDLFLVSIPEWIIYALIAAVIVMAVLVFAVSGAKLRTKIISAVTAVLITVLSFAGIWLDPYFNSYNLRMADSEMTLPYDTEISADVACSDIDYAMKYLCKNHPALMNGLPADMQNRYESAKAEIVSEGSVPVYKLARLTESIFSMLGDAHTCVSAQYSEPLYLKHYYRWKTGEYAIYAINGITVKELLGQKKDIYSFEAESWELYCMKNDLLTVQGLTYLGFSVPDGITYTFVNDDGDERSETYFPEDYVSYHDYCVFNNIEAAAEDQVFVRYTIDEENSLALLTLGSCIYNSVYVNCLHDMFTEVKAKGIKNVAVDLRDNGGGNSLVADEFIKYLDIGEFNITTETMRLGFLNTPVSPEKAINNRYSDLTFTGNVYILTSTGSFSSAMLFPQYIKDNSLGKLIGEPPGNDPNGYGEITSFRMPGSGIWFYVSTKHFRRADRNCPDKYVMPDILCNADEAENILYEIIKV